MARLAAGETVRDIGEALSVAASTVVKWSQRLRATGSVAPGKIGGHVPRKIQGEDEVWLRARVAASRFTLRELGDELAGRGLLVDYRTVDYRTVDYRTVWKFVHGEGLSFKKNRSGQ